jgi:hypothetical protein
MNPFIHDIISQSEAWRTPQKKKEAIPFQVFQSLFDEVQRLCQSSIFASLDKPAAVFDMARLGTFTGSRLSEYGQSKKRKKQRFATVPHDKTAGEWAGTALAFIADDFTLYDANNIRIPHAVALANWDLVETVHVRFRYDKSRENHSIRKFRRNRWHWLDAVEAVQSILLRAQRLKVPSHEPVGVYRCDDRGNYKFIDGKAMQDVLRAACVAAFPDPNHYMRLHIHRIVSHSLRVTAAVALYAQKLTIPEIAHRLRWKEESVEYYIRECNFAIGKLTEEAVQGAMRI